jgi:transcriptional regulator NrdR family protein
MHQIVKRKGYEEAFDERKIYASVYAACMSLRMADGEVELIAQTVTKDVKEAIHGAEVVSSNIIHKHVVKSLEQYNADAAYMYDTHRDIF